jgi:hypothetical protein
MSARWLAGTERKYTVTPPPRIRSVRNTAVGTRSTRPTTTARVADPRSTASMSRVPPTTSVT